jgi:hypothetical protein
MVLGVSIQAEPTVVRDQPGFVQAEEGRAAVVILTAARTRKDPEFRGHSSRVKRMLLADKG